MEMNHLTCGLPGSVCTVNPETKIREHENENETVCYAIKNDSQEKLPR
jgi:hypothetical protein